VEFETRIVDVDAMDAFRAYFERRIRFALGRFSRSIRRVTVRVAATPEDRYSEVAITISLIPKGRVVIIERAGDVHRAIDRGVEAVGRAMAWRMEHRSDAATSR
jgi:ribosome-associated translation inhibitor RaiA